MLGREEGRVWSGVCRGGGGFMIVDAFLFLFVCTVG